MYDGNMAGTKQWAQGVVRPVDETKIKYALDEKGKKYGSFNPKSVNSFCPVAGGGYSLQVGDFDPATGGGFSSGHRGGYRKTIRYGFDTDTDPDVFWKIYDN
jgi:hypothetical protein